MKRVNTSMESDEKRQAQEQRREDSISKTCTIYVLDASRSMGDRLGQTKTAKLEMSKASLVSALSSAKEYNQNDKVGVLSVNTSILGKGIINEVLPFVEILPLLKSKSVPFERIMLVRNEGGTSVYSGIDRALEILSDDNDECIRNVVVITDSRSNNTAQNSAILTKATRSRTRINFIVLGEAKGKSFETFRSMTELTGGQFSMANSSSEIESAISSFRQQKSTPTLESNTNSENELNKGLQERVVFELPPEIVPVLTKRKKAESYDEIVSATEQITREYSDLESSLRNGNITQLQFTEKYSIIQYELGDLRESIRELRSKTSKEITELALVGGKKQGRFQELEQTNKNLLELDRRITNAESMSNLRK
jgi:Mg-chelatase subunit ChlD